MSSKIYEVIVIGGGHAGSEAALISARMGAKTCLITLTPDSIGKMSCNPAIGGVGKGQIVKEIDALGGEMALAIDDTGIQFRTLNTSKGPAARSSRAQADRHTYQKRVEKAVAHEEQLDLVCGCAQNLIIESGEVKGVEVELGGKIEKILSKSVILTSGTFLNGLMHTGDVKTEGGRVGDIAVSKLSQSLSNLGLKMGRMKTGTPPRLSLKSLDLSVMEEQVPELPIRPFSFLTKPFERKQISCWITQTNADTHGIISKNVERSPMFNGQIDSVGARYCPSIEDKVFRFADKNSHTIFVEPEGYDSDIVYPNGISTSLPIDVQEDFVHSIKGMENAEIIQAGYAVEYDFVCPTQLKRTLELKSVKGLYLAGQINGTSGYEEAGGQGLVAGINAVLNPKGESFTLAREESYIGVMIDDLTTKGVLEPYRMFTSRAEYRLSLREDNADLRLTPRGREIGSVNDQRWNEFNKKWERIEYEKSRFNTTKITPNKETNDWVSQELKSKPLKNAINLSELLRRPENSYQDIFNKYPSDICLDETEAYILEVDIKYEGYLKRQEESIAKAKKLEDVPIPDDFEYSGVKALSIEARQRLSEVKPQTLAQASRISGVTPAAISALAIYLRGRC